ncbi:methylamine utilization MauE [Desulfovibrio sp. X2]|uniref:MauE/DoxX family redox-associated membrane protein n=1 Tax=Desulfovibrio sp. X2 TaxID=941449 RepID=UPI000358CB10|nr:MauE/DoxX family redox-associated membrane protein [Desulfovibrio sp. X2]EPR43077.1 methylamine utilization MauE [Desulfovibrio sp. X2]
MRARSFFPRPLYTAVRLVLAAMIIVAGVIKLQDPRVFAVTIDAFGIAPRWLVIPLSQWLPVAEIALGVALAFDLRGSLLVTCLVLLLFIGVLVYAIHIGLDIDCGCYGPSEPEAQAFGTLWTSVYRDLGMIAAAVWLYAARAVHGIAPRSPLPPFTRKCKECDR